VTGTGEWALVGRILVTLLLVGLGIFAVVAFDRATAGDRTAGQVVVVDDYPTPGFEARPEPLGTPSAAPGGGTHRFVQMQQDGTTPVAYDPCRPVHYVMRPDHAPPGGRRIVRAAVEDVAELTGLRFVYDGTTTEAPVADREPFQPDRYGDRWAPVLVSWAHPGEVPDLAGTVAGQAGSLALAAEDTKVFVTGGVDLDSGQLGALLDDGDDDGQAQAIVLHELGHLVGLDHVDDTDQLMHATSTQRVRFAAGDRAGLAVLGRGACVPEL
jgi:hypothetical protein